MIWIDWVLLALLGVSTLIGLWRGLVREVMSILIWVVAIWAALRYSDIAAGYLSGWIIAPFMQALVGFAGVLLVTLAVGGLLVWLIGKLVDSTGLSGTDRLFGMLFGIGRGVIIIAVAVLVARFTAIPQDPWWQASTLLPHFEHIADEGVTLLPEDVQALLLPETGNPASDTAAQTPDDTALDRLDAAATAIATEAGFGAGNEAGNKEPVTLPATSGNAPPQADSLEQAGTDAVDRASDDAEVD